MIIEGDLEGERERHVQSSCSSDTSEWKTCDRGTSCNRLSLSGILDFDLFISWRMNYDIKMMACGLSMDVCDDLERDMQMLLPGLSITTCIHDEF